MKRLRAYFILREISYKLLKAIKTREDAYIELMETVMQIQDEKEVVKRSELTEAERKQYLSKRNDLERLGAKFIESTESVLQLIPELIQQFNAAF